MPAEPVVAFCVVVLPLGAVNLNVTLAPDASVPPFVTNAAMETVLGRKNEVALLERLIASVGAAMTVAFAVPVALEDVVEALRSTEYVPTGVPAGAPLPRFTEADCPGLRVTEEVDKVVFQPAGEVELKFSVLAKHALLSLFVTITE